MTEPREAQPQEEEFITVRSGGSYGWYAYIGKKHQVGIAASSPQAAVRAVRKGDPSKVNMRVLLEVD